MPLIIGIINQPPDFSLILLNNTVHAGYPNSEIRAEKIPGTFESKGSAPGSAASGSLSICPFHCKKSIILRIPIPRCFLGIFPIAAMLNHREKNRLIILQNVGIPAVLI